MEMRIREAQKLGFKRVICPQVPEGMGIDIKIFGVKNVMEMLKLLLDT